MSFEAKISKGDCRLRPFTAGCQLFLVFCLSVVALGGLSAQTTFTWSTLNAGNASGSWATGSNWVGGSAATGAGNTADFSTLDVTANSTITLDGNQTIGNIKFGDTGTATNALWTVNAGTPGTSVLTLQASSGTPLITADGGAASAVFISVPVGGTQGLAKTGSISLVLTGTNTWTGGTTIQSGALQVGSGGTTGNLGSGAILNNGSLVINRSDAMTISDAISGTGSLIKAGAGTLTLSGNNSYTASTTLSGGTISVASLANGGSNSGIGASSSAATSLVFTGGTLQFTGGIVTTDRLFSVGTSGATINITSAGAINFSNTGAMGFAGQSGARTLTFSNTVAGSNVMAFTIGDNGGATSLVKSGNGNLLLTGTNTYSGTTTINAGTLQVGNGGATGSLGTGDVIDNGTLSFFRTGTVTATQVISGTGGLSTLGGGQLDLGGANTYSGVTSFSGAGLIITVPVLANGGLASSVGASTNAATNLVLTNAITLRYTGTGGSTDRLFSLGATSGGATIDASGTGAINFTNTGSIAYNSQSGARTLTLTGTNTGANTMTPAIGDNGGATAISKTGTGTWVLAGANTYSGTTTVSAGSLQIGSGGTSGTLGTGSVSVFGNLTFNRSDNVTVSNTIAGAAGTVTKVGTGTLTLTGNNSYSGATTISSGVLSVSTVANGSTASPIGASSNAATNLVLNGGTFQYAGTGGSTDRLFSVGTSGGTLDSSGTGAVTFASTGAIGFNSQTGTRTLTLTGSNTGNNILNPAIGDNGGATSLVKSGAGTWILTGGNTYTGTTTISAGTLQVGNGSTLGSLGFGAVSNSGSLVVNRSNNITISASITGSGTFVQNGTGTTTLSGLSNGWSMATVNAGTLLPGTASSLGSGTFSAMTVNSGGTLGTNGFTVTGVGSLAGSGTLQNGASAASNFSTGSANTSTTFSGLIQNGGTGALSIQKTGSGTFTVSGVANTYTGATIVTGGVLSVPVIANGGTNSTIGASTNAATNLVLNGGTLRYTGAAASTDRLFSIGTISGTLDASGTGALSFTNTGSIGFNSQTGARTLTLTGTSTDANTLAVLVADNGGATALTKTGTGTWVLTGANSYTGTTNVSAGTLQVGNGGTTGKLGTGAITDSGKLVINRSDAVTVSNLISGTGSLTQAGPGSLTVNTANSYTGATIIKGGTFITPSVANAGTASGLGAASTLATNLIIDGGVLQYDGSSVSTDRLFSVGTGGATITGIGAINFTNTGSLGFNGQSGARTLTFSTSATTTLSPIIADNGGATSVTKSGDGVVRLVGNNTYSGTTTISGLNWLEVGNNGTTGTLGSGPVIDNAALRFSRTDTITVSNLISGTGVVTEWNNAGTGVTILTGNNTYTGPTVIIAGTLSVSSLADGGASSNIGASSSAASSLILGGTNATLKYTGPAVSTNRLFTVSSGTSVIDASGTGPLSFTNTGSIVQNAGVASPTLTLTGSNTGANTLAPIIVDGSFPTLLTKLGAGTWILTGNNTYSGTTTISGGALQAGSGGTSGTLGTGNIVDNAVLVFNRTDTLSVPGNITGTGALTNSGTGTTILTGTNTYAGATLINAGSIQLGSGGTTGSVGTAIIANNGNLTVNRSDTFTLANTITGTGSFTQSGTGTTVFTGTKSYSGPTNIDAGKLQAGAASAFSSSSAVTVASSAVLEINGFNSVIGSLAGAGTVQNGSATGATLNAGSNNGSTTFSGVIQNGGSGVLAFNKTGTGTLIISGTNNSYTGGTVVGAGVLSVSSIADGGTNSSIGASSTSSSNLFLNGGTLAYTGAATSSNRLFSVSTLGGTLDASGTGALAFTGTGSMGFVSQTGTRTLTLTGTNTGANTITPVIGDNSGATTLVKSGVGTWVLAGNNTYSGTTTINAGTLQVGNGGTTGSLGSAGVVNNGNLTFNRSNAISVANNISGTGSVTISGTGDVIFIGTNTYSGATIVNAGTLRVDGSVAGSSVIVNNGGALGGSGTVSSAVTVNSGGVLAPGDSPGTLSVSSLTLNAGALSSFQLGKPGIIGAGESDLTNVTNDLALDGTLNVSAQPNFATGAYRLFIYGGTLTDNILDVGTVPIGYDAANFVVSKAVANQINLIVTAGPSGPVTQFWDGPGPVNDASVQGGNGTWNNFNTNFTDPTGTTNGSWQNGVALFGATAGKVTLGDNIHFTGLQFMTSGYEVAGDGGGLFSLIPTGTGVVTVDSGVSATISAPMTGTGGLDKQGSGTLALTNANTYAGGTIISSGVLQLGNGGTTGSILGNVSDNGTLAFNRSNGYTFAGDISGTGGVRQSGTGTTTLSGTNTYTGSTVVAAGTLQAGSTAAFGKNSAVNISAAGGTLDLAGFNNSIGSLSGVAGTLVQSAGGAATLSAGGDNSDTAFAGSLKDGVGGVLSVEKNGTGTLTLTGSNTYTGATTITGGALQIGNGGASGTLGTGAVTDNASLIINRSDEFTLANAVSGTGELVQAGSGTTILTGANTYSGDTIINAGRLQVGAGGTSGSLGTGAVVDNGELSFKRSDAISVGQLISGTGSLIQEGTGVTALTNANTYTGGTTINAGSLWANNTSGSAAGSGSVVINSGGTLGGSGAVSGPVALNSGGSLAPGTSVASTLTLGSLTWNGGGTISSRVGLGGDLLQLTGLLLQGTAGSYAFHFSNNGTAVPNTIYQVVGFSGTDFASSDAFSGNALQFDPGGSPLGIFAPLFTLTSTGLYANFQGPLSGPSLQNAGPVFVPTYADFIVTGVAATGSSKDNNTVNSLNFLPGSSLTVFNTLNVTSGGLYQLGGSSSVSGGTLHSPNSFVINVIGGAGLNIGSDLTSPGGLSKTGNGTLTLTGHVVLGGTAGVIDGTLVLDGSLSTPQLHIYQGATLLGTGTLFGDLLNSGVVNPGHSPGTLHVHGNYTQTSSGTLVLEVAGLNNHDQLVVSGTARLGGTLDVRNYGGHRLVYGDVVRDFLTAGRITGRFSRIAMPSANLRGRILNEGNSLSLIAAPASYTLVARTENQLHLAKALDHWIGIEKGDVGTVTLALDLLREEEYPAAFNAISPAYYAALPSVHIEQSIAQSSLLGQRMSALRAGARGVSVLGVTVPPAAGAKVSKSTSPVTAVEDDKWGAFVQLSGQFAEMESFQNLSDSRFNTAGALAGFDYRIRQSTHIGMSVGYGYTELNFDKGDTTTLSEGRVAFYSTMGLGHGFFIETTVGGALSADDVKRPIKFGTLDRTATGEATTGQVFSAIILGRDFKSGNWTLTPKTGVQYTYYRMSGLDEQGAGALGLHLDGHSVQSFRYSLGAQLAYSAVITDKIKATPYVFATWQHEFENRNSTLTASLSEGAGPFDYQYRGLQRDRASVGTGLMLELGLRTSLNLGYQADFGSSDYISHLIFLQIARKF